MSQTKRSLTWQSLIAICFLALFGLPATANDLRNAECRAVQNMASITLSGTLIYSIAKDERRKHCNFFISMPPASTSHSSLGPWTAIYASASADPKTIASAISSLALAAIPKDASVDIKEVVNKINENIEVLSRCHAALSKKENFVGKSLDGAVSCFVPSSGDQMVATVAVGDAFTSVVALPRLG